MKIFLTGGTGFIGQHLARELLAQGHEVVALARRPDSPHARALARMGARVVPGDITDRESLREAMAAADAVVHNAGYYEYGLDAEGRRRMQAVNVRGTEHALGLALELGISRAVYVSTVLAYGDSGPQPRDESFTRQAPCRIWYERTKTDAHAVALSYQQRGLPLVIVCPNGVVGPNDHAPFGYFVRMYLNRILPPTAWAPETILALVEVDDLARGIALATVKGRPGETYFLSGEPRRLHEHLGYWSLRPGGLKSRLWLPTDLMALSFWPFQPLQRMAGLPAFMSRETVLAGATNLNFSSAKAVGELGWSYRPARDMWLATLDGEIELLARRKRRDLVSRLNPVEPEA